MANKVKAWELRSKSKEELEKQLESLKQELYALRIAKVTGSSAQNLLNIKRLRKGIARVLTIMHEKRRAELKKAFAGKKFIPIDIREKSTRAYRRRLLPRHQNAKLLKTVKKEVNFPPRKFALRP